MNRNMNKTADWRCTPTFYRIPTFNLLLSTGGQCLFKRIPLEIYVGVHDHQDNMSVQFIPLTPHFYSVKLGSIHSFLIFALKHKIVGTHYLCFEHE